jgi:hypothetical protein
MEALLYFPIYIYNDVLGLKDSFNALFGSLVFLHFIWE